jgi:urease accessory protein
MGLDGTTDTTPRARQGASAERLLFLWLSPSFPVGAFAYSQGLEMAVEHGLVTSRATLETWLATLIDHGSLRNDLIVLGAAHTATQIQDSIALTAANDLACALQPSMERYLETTQQGGSFLQAIAANWTAPAFTAVRVHLGDIVAYPIALGIAAGAHAIPIAATRDAFAFAWATNQTSAAIRLSVIGQTDAQGVIAALAAPLTAAAIRSATQTLDDIGSATFSADLASLEHETQYSRLFRS